MFVGNQSFLGSWGRSFVGNVIMIIWINTCIKQIIAYRFVGMKVRGQELPTKATNIGPPRTMMIPQYTVLQNSDPSCLFLQIPIHWILV